MSNKVLVTTSSFGKFDDTPSKDVESAGLKYIFNPLNKKLTNTEANAMLLEHKPVGLVAGTEKLDREVLTSASGFLKVISRVGTGWNNIDHDAAKELGISVYRTPDAPTMAVAELAVGFMLSVLRKISLADSKIRNGEWAPIMGNLLSDKTIGIIGMGKIGQQLTDILFNGFGAKIVAFDPFLPDEAWGSINCRQANSLEELLKNSDIISIHIPELAEGEYLIGKNEIELMKDSAILINSSRGGLVDEDALKSALDSGKLGGAGLDVYENEPYDGPLLESDKVVMTMHMGSYAKEARIRMEKEAVENLLAGLKEKGVL